MSVTKEQFILDMKFNADVQKARKDIKSLQEEMNKLNFGKLMTDSSKSFDDVRKITSEVTKMQAILKTSVDEKGLLDIDKVSEGMKRAGLTVQDLHKSMSALGPEGEKAFQNIARQVSNAEPKLRKTNALIEGMWTTLKNTLKWRVSTAVIGKFTSSIQQAYDYAQDLNKSLNDIRIVSGESTENMKEFAKWANESAKANGNSTKAYAEAALIYYQQGLAEEEVKKRTEATMKMTNVTGEAAEQVSSYMTAIWNNFAKGSDNLEYYADVMTALGAATASSSAEIAAGLEKFAAVGETVGLSYEYATAALATVIDKTRQGADTVGTSFKTLFSRLEGLQLGETLEDGTDLNKYSKALAVVGVNIKEQNGDLKDMDTILDELGNRWKTLADDQKVALAQTVGGVRQYTQLIALMDNWDAFQENVGVARNSEGTLNEQQEIYAEGWEAAQKRVKAAMETIYQDLINDEFFIDMLNNLETAIDLVEKLIKGMGGVGGVLSSLGSLGFGLMGKQISSTIDTSLYNLGYNQRKQASEELRQTFWDAQAGTPDGSRKQEVLANYAEFQDTFITLQEKMTAEDKEHYKVLLDKLRVLDEEAIALEESKNAIREKLNAAKEELKLAKEVQASSNFLDNYKEKGFSDTEVIDYLGKKDLLSEEEKNKLNSFTVGIKDHRTSEFKDAQQEQLKYLKQVYDEKVKFYGREEEKVKELEKTIADLTKQYKETAKDSKNTDHEISSLETTLKHFNLSVSEMTAGEQFTTIARTVSTTAMVIQNLKGIMSTLFDDTLSPGEKAIAIFSSLATTTAFMLPQFSSLSDQLKKMIVQWTVKTAAVNVDTAAMKGNSEETKNNTKEQKVNEEATEDSGNEKLKHAGKTNVDTGANKDKGTTKELFDDFMASGAGITTMWIAVIIAAIAATAVLVKHELDQLVTEEEKALEAAKKEAEAAKQQLTSTKQAYDDLVSGNENYRNSLKQLDELTKGTTEYRMALMEANQQAFELMEKYEGLTGHYEGEQFIIDESSYQKVLEEQAQAYQAAQIRNINAKTNLSNTELNAQLRETATQKNSIQKAYEQSGMVGAVALALAEGVIGAAGEWAQTVDQQRKDTVKMDELRQLFEDNSDELRDKLKKELDLTDEQLNDLRMSMIENRQAVQDNTIALGKLVGGDTGNDLEAYNAGQMAEADLVAYRNALEGKSNDELFNMYAQASGLQRGLGTIFGDERFIVENGQDLLRSRSQVIDELTNLYGNAAISALTDAGRYVFEHSDSLAEELAKTTGENQFVLTDAIMEMYKLSPEELNSILNSSDITEENKNIFSDYYNNIETALANTFDQDFSDKLLNSGAFTGAELEGFVEKLYSVPLEELKKLSIDKLVDLADNINAIDLTQGIYTIRQQMIAGLEEAGIEGADILVDAFIKEVRASSAQANIEQAHAQQEAIAKYSEYDTITAKEFTELPEIVQSYFQKSGIDEYTYILTDEMEKAILEGLPQPLLEDWKTELDRTENLPTLISELEAERKALEEESISTKELDEAQSAYNEYFSNPTQTADYMLSYNATSPNYFSVEEIATALGKEEYLTNALEVAKANYDEEVATRDAEINDLTARIEQAETELNAARSNVDNYAEDYRYLVADNSTIDDAQGGIMDEIANSDVASIAEVYTDEVMKALIGNEAENADVDIEQLKEYGDYLQRNIENLQDEEVWSDRLALKIIELNNGLEDIGKNWESWNEILSSGEEDTLEYQEAIDGLRADLSKVFDVNKSRINDNFIIQNLEQINKLAEGDMTVLQDLQKSMALDLAEQFGADGVLVQQINDIISGVDFDQIEIGASLDDTDFMNSLIAMLKNSGMAADQIQEMMDALGWEVQMEEVETQVLDWVPPGHVEPRTIKQQIWTGFKKSDAKHINRMPSSSGKSGGSRSSKEGKDVIDESERYHVIKEQMADINEQLEHYAELKDRAFGPEHLKYLQKEITEAANAIEAEKEYIKEIQEYYDYDKANIAAFGATFDENGVITNYDALVKEQVDAYNAAVERYNNGGSEEDFKAAEENWEKFKKYLDTYEETNNLLSEQLIELNNLEAELFAKRLEAIEYKVEIGTEVDDRDLNYLDSLLEKVKDDAYATAQAIALLGEETEVAMDKSEIYRKGIEGILDASGIDLDAWMSGQISQDQLLNSGLTQQQIDDLNEYTDGLLECNKTLQELKETVAEDVYNSFKKFSDEIDKEISKFGDYEKILKSYNNIVDTVGQKYLEVSNEIMESLGQINFNNSVEELDNNRRQLEEMERERDYYNEQLMDTGEGIWQDKLNEIDELISKQKQTFLSSWEDAVKAAAELYKTQIENAINSVLNDLDYALERFNKSKEVDELYLDDYEQIYELSKLNRDINNSIDDTDNIASKQALIDLQKELNDLDEAGVKLTEKDVEYYRAKYELRLAEMALEEAQNAKSVVRMNRDNEGNWSYIYGADQEAVEDLEQDYENKLYNMQKLIQDYMDELQGNMLETEKDYLEALKKIEEDTTLSEEERKIRSQNLYNDFISHMNVYSSQMDEYLSHSKELYDEDWTSYSEATGYKISTDEEWRDKYNETYISTLNEGVDNTIAYADEVKAVIGSPDAPGTLLGDTSMAYEQWEQNIKTAMENASTDSFNFADNFTEAFVDVISQINKDTNDLGESLETLIDKSEDAFNTIVDSADMWQTSYNDSVNSLIDNNEQLISSYNDVLRKLKELAEQQDISVTPTVSELGTPVTTGGSKMPSGGSGNGGGGGSPHVTPSPKVGTTEKYGFTDYQYNAIKGIFEARGKGSQFYRIWQQAADALHMPVRSGSLEEIMSAGGRYFNSSPSSTKEDIKRLIRSLGYAQFDTGGYTGAWGNAGKLAVLHQKELVLNSQDTENILGAVDIIRDIADKIDLSAHATNIARRDMKITSALGGGMEQNVHITAEFPGVTEHIEIERALNNLINTASQYVNRK